MTGFKVRHYNQHERITMTYQSLNEQLTGRNQQRRKLGNNTYAERRESGAIAIRLHNTNVLTFNQNGSVVVTSGGWKTSTTKDRINSYLPHGLFISQEKGVWYWHRRGGNGKPFVSFMFTDGDVIRENGTVKMQCNPGDEKATLKLRKRIGLFARKCADAVPLPRPGAGDCFYCQMVTQGGVAGGIPLGDATNNHSHLESHLDEGYVVPSLVYHALKERGCTDFILGCVFDERPEAKLAGFTKRHVTGAVRKYLCKRFGLVS